MIDSQPAVPNSGRKLFYGLFVFPLLIAVGMAVLLCTVVLLTRESETPESLITAIKTGSPSKRWQKAFELSNELNRDPAMIRSSAVMKEVIHILKDRSGYDARTRSYMAIALSRFEGEEAAPALHETLRAETEEEVLLYLLWALGQKAYRPARPDIETYLASPKEDLKKMAAYVLGALGETESVTALLPLVDDESRDVRWNAALALARLGSDAGHAELLKMIDRPTLVQTGIPADKADEVMINAVKGLGLLKRGDAMPILEELSRSDPSLKVRQAALEVLQNK
jgi:HEAT repeat protein